MVNIRVPSSVPRMRIAWTAKRVIPGDIVAVGRSDALEVDDSDTRQAPTWALLSKGVPQKEPRQPSIGLDLGLGLTFRRAPALNACLVPRSRLKKHFTRL